MNSPYSDREAYTSTNSDTPSVTSAPKALGTSVSADLEALRNDVEQAREMACEYQRQLAGKANDHALLKSLFEKTRDDLVHLHKGIAQLREERHRFANDAMKATALEMKLERVTRERDQLQGEVHALRDLRASQADARVIELTREVERLQRELRFREAAPEAPKASAKVSLPPETIKVAFTDENWDDASVTIVPTESDPRGAGRMWRRR